MVSPDQHAVDVMAVMALGRGAALPPAPATPVHDLVAEIALLHPDRIAVRSAGRAATYAELLDHAARITARLADAGAAPGSRVALLAQPSVATIAAVLGILRTGAAYVPIDPAQPAGRIAEILADACVTAVAVTSSTASRVPDGFVLIDVDEVAVEPAPPALVKPEDPAYLIYTSGSTGEPKGVLVGHRQLAASTAARRHVYPAAPTFLLVSPLAFDSSVAGLWGTLTTGGCLVAATPDEVRDPELLIRLISDHRVTQMLCVPSLYAALLAAAGRLGSDPLASLENVIVAGEPLPDSLMSRHFQQHPGVALVNEYGPTEGTVWATYQWFDAPAPVTIGGPIPGSRLYVLDERLNPVAPGVEGELFLGGAGVADGYFGRPDATAACFLDDPFAEVTGARMYRTGDRVRWNDSGTLDFIGRRDDQVKIRGHRVELGAVEAALRALPAVREAAVIAEENRIRLHAFVQTATDTSTESIRAELAKRLPAVMVPATIRILDEFPLLVSGKVDRSSLRRMASEPPAEPPPRAPAAEANGDTVAMVTAAWAQVLKLSHVPPDVNFFDLGGNSLSMFHLQDALESHTGTRPSVVALFEHTTVSQQVTLIRKRASASKEPARDVSARRAQALRARQQRAEREAVQ